MSTITGTHSIVQKMAKHFESNDFLKAQFQCLCRNAYSLNIFSSLVNFSKMFALVQLHNTKVLIKFIHVPENLSPYIDSPDTKIACKKIDNSELSKELLNK